MRARRFDVQPEDRRGGLDIPLFPPERDLWSVDRDARLNDRIDRLLARDQTEVGEPARRRLRARGVRVETASAIARGSGRTGGRRVEIRAY
jgi:hypothetical protein